MNDEDVSYASNIHPLFILRCRILGVHSMKLIGEGGLLIRTSPSPSN